MCNIVIWMAPLIIKVASTKFTPGHVQYSQWNVISKIRGSKKKKKWKWFISLRQDEKKHQKIYFSLEAHL